MIKGNYKCLINIMCNEITLFYVAPKLMCRLRHHRLVSWLLIRLKL